MSEIALVVVDVQRDFLDVQTAVGSTEKAFCVAGIRQSLEIAREQGWRVIHVGTEHEGQHTLPLHQQRRGLSSYCERGSAGAEFVVLPEPGDVVVHKSWYSAFQSTLDDHLDGVSTVVWTGVATDCCIYQSAFDGDRRGLRNIVPIQAVSATKCETFVASLMGLAKSAAEIIDLERLADSADGSSAALDLSDIEQLAGQWFAAQQERIKATATSNLEDVLDVLADDSGSS